MPRSPLSPTQYYEILISHLVPMFAGSELDSSPIPCDIDGDMVVSEAHGSLLVRTDSVWPHHFRLRRTHPFDESDIRIVTQFVRALGEKLVASEHSFFGYLIDKCPQDVVSWSMQHRTMDDSLLPTIITTLQKWASQTYEGGRISVSIGVDCAPKPSRISSVHLQDVVGRDYAKVLSNGIDTILVVSPSGHIVEHVALCAKNCANTRTSEALFAPNRYLPLAGWVKGARVALTLNRQGEILVFKDQRLQFAFRRGAWSHFSHQALIARMGGLAEQRRLMKAVYASCLDISFARTGGCIAVANGMNANRVSDYLNSGDLLASRKTNQAQVPAGK